MLSSAWMSLGHSVKAILRIIKDEVLGCLLLSAHTLANLGHTPAHFDTFIVSLMVPQVGVMLYAN